MDVLSKRLAVRELTGQEPVEVIGDFLQLRLVRNPGAAFSAGASLTPVISVVAIIATVVVIYFALPGATPRLGGRPRPAARRGRRAT